MEIGNVIDFHVPNTGNNIDGTVSDHQKCPRVGNSTDKSEDGDYCARIYVDRNNALIIRANGFYYQPLSNTNLPSYPVRVTDNETAAECISQTGSKYGF